MTGKKKRGGKFGHRNILEEYVKGHWEKTTKVVYRPRREAWIRPLPHIPQKEPTLSVP